MADNTEQNQISIVRYNKRALYLVGLILFLVILAAFVAIEAQKNNGLVNDSEAKELSSPKDAWYRTKPDFLDRPIAKPVTYSALPPIPPAKEPEDLTLKRKREAEYQAMQASTKITISAPPGRSVNELSKKSNNELETLNATLSKIALPNSSAPQKKDLFEQLKDDIHPSYLNEVLQKPISPFELKAGSLIPAALITGINSELPGQIIAQVTENVFDTVSGRYLLVPQGTRLIGAYESKIEYGQERVLIAWKRLIMPDGKSLNLKGMPGVDQEGYSGFNDQVNNHYGRIFGSAILMSFITAGVQLSQPQEYSYRYGTSPGQEMSAALGQNLGEVSAQMVEKNMNIAPTLEIRPGYLFNVMVTQDVVFPRTD